VLLSASGERPPAADAPLHPERMTRFGRAALRVLYALDNFRDYAAPPHDDLILRGKVLPGWSVRLLVGALLLPPLLMGIDALARLRRRHEPLGAWGVWALAGALPFLMACLFAVILATIGLISVAPGAPVPPQALELGAGPVVAFVAILLVFALGWLVARPALLHSAGAARPTRRSPTADQPGGVVAVGLTTVVVAGALWLGNPYAAALVVPAAHLWPWALTPDLRLPRSVSLAIVVLALAPLALVGLLDARAFDMGAVHGAWFWTILVAGGHVPVGSWVLWCLVWGCAVGAGLLALRRRRRSDDDPDEVTVRGPVTYAGPGSLGGTPSGLRR
jgi:hypothetical protein